MHEKFTFTLKATSGGARLGEVAMPRGVIRTPAFMPVGTVGTVKAMYLDQVREPGGRYHSRQYLSPDAAARPGARGKAWRVA